MSLPLSSVQFDASEYAALLNSLIAVSATVQNCPTDGLVAREEVVTSLVEEYLAPVTDTNKYGKNAARLERVTIVEGRPNLLASVGSSAKDAATLTMAGMHQDVVPVGDLDTWACPATSMSMGSTNDPAKTVPFDAAGFEELRKSSENVFLFGRGVTDCLGHVALVAHFIRKLVESGADLDSQNLRFGAVFIADEEDGSGGCGISEASKLGALDSFKNGPVVWMDSADARPCLGTGGAIQWRLTCKGKQFHSGVVDQAVNAIEMGVDAFAKVQAEFHRTFSEHPKEKEYGFTISSTMKITNIKCSSGGLNAIRGECIIEGDCRLTPFYDVAAVEATLKQAVATVNKEMETLVDPAVRGPHSKYVIPSCTGSVELSFIGPHMEGIAVEVDGLGYSLLKRGLEASGCHDKPFAITGSLPLVRDLQRSGMDLLIVGFGYMSAYHAVNEYACINNMAKGFSTVRYMLEKYADEKPNKKARK